MDNPTLLGIAGLVLVLVGQTAALIAWFLKREKDHENGDGRKHDDLSRDLQQIRDKHASLSKDVSGLSARVDAMPDRDTLDQKLNLLETKMDARFSGISETLDSRFGSLNSQLSQLIQLQIENSQRRNRRDSDE